jgi:hypothetical protein
VAVLFEFTHAALCADGPVTSLVGDQLFQAPCTGSAYQPWSTGLTPVTGRVTGYTITNPVSGLRMEVYGGSNRLGLSVVSLDIGGPGE